MPSWSAKNHQTSMENLTDDLDYNNSIVDDKKEKIAMDESNINGRQPSTEWGSVLSKVVDQLPTVDSDSEVSTLTDDSDGENYIFQRNVGVDPIMQPASTTSTQKEVSPDSATLLFKRLDCQAPQRGSKDFSAFDADLPLYEDDFESYCSQSDLSYSSIAESSEALDSLHGSVNVPHAAPSGTSPVLSLQALDDVNLDSLLENVDVTSLRLDDLDQQSDECRDIESPCSELMAQLEQLSIEQSGPSRDAVNEPQIKGSDDFAAGSAGGAQGHFLAESHVKKDPGGNLKKTNSCGVSANLLPALAELTCSEPTTIYLDLREQDTDNKERAETKALNVDVKKQPSPKRPVKHLRGTTSRGTSTSTPQQSALDDIKEESASDSDEDDFEKWRTVRNKFKSKVATGHTLKEDKALAVTSPAISRPGVDGTAEEANVKPGNSAPHALPKCSRKSATDFSDLNSIEAKKELVRLTLEKVKDVKEKMANSGLTNGHSTPPPEGGTLLAKTTSEENKFDCNGVDDGIYASQRLKKSAGGLTENGPTAKVNQKSSSGKTTVLFAEEPRTDPTDTTNVYRSKRLTSPEKIVRPLTSLSVQTDESFSTRPTTNGPAKTADELLTCSTADLRSAVQKLVEERRMQESENKQKRWNSAQPRTPYSIVQNQRKQPPSDYVATSLASGLQPTSPHIPWENRAKLSALLEQTFKENVSDVDAKLFPCLYDREASFGPHLDILPPAVDPTNTYKMALLSFQMTSPGCIVHTRTSGAHRPIPVDQGNSFPLTYPLLLSWLLALVPDNAEKPHDPPRADVFALETDTDQDSDGGGFLEGKEDECDNLLEVPFNVVSIQQVWQEDTQSMVVNAVVVPNFFFKPDTNIRRKKPKKENAFYQVVWHFLQSNRIQDVCPWHSRPESPIYHLNEIAITCSTKPLSTFITATNDPLLLQKALNRKPGFFWKSLPVDDQSSLAALQSENNKLETTVCLLQRESFTYPVCLMDLIIKLQLYCLDIVGLRLSFVTNGTVQKNILSYRSCGNRTEIVPCISLAVRGKSAIKKVQGIIGPKDPVLARLTDRNSLNALYGDQLSKRRGDMKLPTEMNVFHCPRSVERIEQQLTVWFGGRFESDDDLTSPSPPATEKIAPPSSKINGKGKTKSRSNSSSSENSLSATGSVLTKLVATPHLTTCRPSRICLIVSSRFPPQYLGDVLTIACDQGFAIEGLKRMTLTERKVTSLNVSSRYAVYFNPPSSVDEPITEEYYEIDNWWQRPVTVLVLARENASAHQAGLISCLQTDLMYRMVASTEQGHLHAITSQCFHVCPFNDAISHVIGPLCKFPDVELSSGISPRAFFSDPELEQVVVLTLLGHPMIAECSCILQTLLHGEFSSREDDIYNSSYLESIEDSSEPSLEFHGFELLGIKYIPCVSAQHAKELTPFEVGTRPWYDSIPIIKDSPALLCVLRRVNAFDIVRSVLSIDLDGNNDNLLPHSHNLDRLMSSTPEISYRQIKTFFCEKELFADNRCRPLLKYLPPPLRVAQYLNGNNFRSDDEEGAGDPVINTQSTQSKNAKKNKKRKSKELQAPLSPTDESVFDFLLSWPQPLTSLMIIKPDAFPRHFVKLLRRLHQEDFAVVAARMTQLSEDQASQIMPSRYEKKLGERNVFISHVTSSASLVLSVQRNNAVRRLLDVAGPSDPRDALRLSRRGHANWRAEFGIDEFSNAIHVSERYVSACEEQKLFFPEGLCCHETLELRMEHIPAPAQDHVMCEDKMKGRQVKFRVDPDTEVLGPSGMEIQPVCVALTAPLVRPRHSQKQRQPLATPKPLPPYVEVLEQLMVQGFELCALRMCWFRQRQAELLYDIAGEQSQEKRKETIKNLTTGPSLVMLMQRENGLVLFDSILASCLKKHPFMQHSRNFLRTQTLTQTKQCAKYLFHRVECNRSILEIVHKRALEWQERNGI